uniref:SECIS binding protein 2 like n=1 Tax=Leptobrachium leishanense TaxID=445787 RepID=A0A8C5WFC2_9ANUR
MDMNEQNIKLSAEVEPFIPQKKGADAIAIPMAVPGDSGGGLEATPIPHYLVTCYPFVQENQSNRQFPLYNNDIRWQQSTSNPPGPYLAYPIIPTQPPVSTEYMYYQLMPAPCAQVMGFYHPFPPSYPSPLQAGNPVSAVSVDCGDRASQQAAQISMLSSQRNRISTRGPLIHKPPQQLLPQIKYKRPPMKSVAVQKETCASGPDTRSKVVLLMDACQQTDFPSEIANKSLCESMGATPWKSKPRRRRSSHPAGESSSEQGASEADIDSDSGYCSPKHCQAAAMCSRHTDCTALNVPDPAASAVGGTWASVASQATQKRPWNDKSQAFSRGGRPVDLRNNAQLGHRLRGQSTSSERRQNIQRKNDNKAGATAQVNRPEQGSEHLYFEDEDEFPELNSSSSSGRNENGQPKMAAKVEALSKASGKKSKTPVQLDLGDMLAELERQQQAMKARQITNTRPLSYTVGSTVPFHAKDHANRNVFAKAPSPLCSPNPLDSTAPRVKRGKEKEIPKIKRPTALKKIILKEREEKKGRLPMEASILGSEEQKEVPLNFTDDQYEQGASQEEAALSAQSDTSLSPASQNSPYCMTPVSQGSPASSGIGSPMASSAITKIHSKRFREYCNQVLSKEIDECVTVLLQELVSFQERVYQKDPIKAKSKRRLVMGLREVTKHMKLNKIKCVIISPNCEKIQSKGGLDEALYNVIAMAREQEIPFVFALGRKALGRCVNKLVPVSVVGIFSFSGAEKLFNNLVSLTEEARKAYKDMVSSMEQEQAEEALKNVKKVTHHMGHSRNPSAASAISFCSVISEPISEVNEKDYETNWRSMVETSDGLETSENEECSVVPSAPEQDLGAGAPKPPATKVAISTTSVASPCKLSAPDKEEVKPDDNLEWASQQSTETGSWDGSSRDVLSSSITSTTSTLVPEMLEEADDDDDDDDEKVVDGYHQEPSSVRRIEFWVSETRRTMESLQLVNSLNSPEEDNLEPSEDDEIESSEQAEPVADCKERTAEKHPRNGATTQNARRSSLKESSDTTFI